MAGQASTSSSASHSFEFRAPRTYRALACFLKRVRSRPNGSAKRNRNCNREFDLRAVFGEGLHGRLRSSATDVVGVTSADVREA